METPHWIQSAIAISAVSLIRPLRNANTHHNVNSSYSIGLTDGDSPLFAADYKSLLGEIMLVLSVTH